MTEFGHISGWELIRWHHGPPQTHSPNVIGPRNLFTIRKRRERPGLICTQRHIVQRWLCEISKNYMIWWINSWSLDSSLDHSIFVQVKTLKLSQHNPCIKSSICSVQKHSAVKVLIHDSCQCFSKHSSTVLKVQTASALTLFTADIWKHSQWLQFTSVHMTQKATSASKY